MFVRPKPMDGWMDGWSPALVQPSSLILMMENVAKMYEYCTGLAYELCMNFDGCFAVAAAAGSR